MPSPLVKVSTVKRLTGWSANQIRNARRNGEVKMVKNRRGIWYDINSIHPLLIKAK